METRSLAAKDLDALTRDLDANVAEVLDRYTEQLDEGSAPSRAQLLADHPSIADELAKCLDGIEFVHNIRQQPVSVARTIGDFRIVREIGHGGMGVVYEAEQISLKRRVALKIMRHAVADRQAMERFQREAETVARLHHTNIVPIHAVGSESGVHYYAMQFIEGKSLADVLRDGTTNLTEQATTTLGVDAEATHPPAVSPLAASELPPEQVAQWGLEAAEALAHAHERGVIHRDVKPSNLLCDYDEGRIWLTDFGLAKRLEDARLSLTGAILGTPRYMSPEQASSVPRPVDHRTDIYSLGASLYELLTGSPVFDAESPHVVIGQILNSDPRPLRTLRLTLPRDLETIVMKCLAKDPADRYATAEDLANDLRAFIEGRPIKARRITVLETARRWLRKHSRVATLATSVAVLTATAVLGAIAVKLSLDESRLGQIRFDTDQPPLVAELLDDDGQLVRPSFTIPTQQPLKVPAGQYDLRLTTPGRLGETVKVSVNRQASHELMANLPSEPLGSPLTIPRAYELIDIDGRIQVVLIGLNDVARVDLLTGKREWRTEFASRKRRGKSNSQGVAFDWQWMELRNASTAGFAINKPHLVKPLQDLDGDGHADFVFVLRHRIGMVALSGISGEPLWIVNTIGKVKSGQARSFYSAPSETISCDPLIVGDVNGDGSSDYLVTCFDNPGSASQPRQLRNHVAAISGRDGSTLWSKQLNPKWFLASPGQPQPQLTRPRTFSPSNVESFDRMHQSFNSRQTVRMGTSWSNLNPSSMETILHEPLVVFGWQRGQSVSLLAAGKRLVIIDNSSGEVLREIKLKSPPVRAPQLADLDGQGVPEILVCMQSKSAAQQSSSSGTATLEAWSLDKDQPLWQEEIEADWDWRFTRLEKRPDWPMIVDLDCDERRDVIVANGNSVNLAHFRYSPFGRLQIFDGVTGKPKWVNPPKIRHMDQQVDRFCVGPDIDGDGTRDLLITTLVGRGSRNQSLVYVDALSGADGRRLWWGEHLLETRQSDEFRIGEILLWNTAPNGWPQLVVEVLHNGHAKKHGQTLFFSCDNGRLLRIADRLVKPFLRDVDRDGRNDLILFQAESAQSDLMGGKLTVWPGTPGQPWIRLGDELATIRDINADGTDDLVRKQLGNQRNIEGIDGQTGRRLWQRPLQAPAAVSVVLDGDFNGDEINDILYLPRLHYRTPAEIISGRTGVTIRSLSINLRRSQDRHLVYLCRDLNGDEQADLLYCGLGRIGNMQASFGAAPVSSFQYWACIDGRTGKPFWEEQLGPPDSYQFAYPDHLPIALADFTGNGQEEIVQPILYRNKMTLRVISATDARPLWERDFPHTQGTLTISQCPSFVAADLDGDERAELVVLEYPPAGQGARSLKLSVFAYGEENAIAEIGLPVNLSTRSYGMGKMAAWGRPIPVVLRVADAQQRRLGLWIQKQQKGGSAPFEFVVVDLQADSSDQAAKRHIPLVPSAATLEAATGQTSLTGSRVTHQETFRVWPCDVDGDGTDEIVFHDASHLRAVSLTDGRSLWNWSLPGSRSVVNSIRQQGDRIEIVLQSDIDRRDDAPDRQGQGTTGIYAVDARTGKTVWESESPWLIDSLHGESITPLWRQEKLPLISYRDRLNKRVAVREAYQAGLDPPDGLSVGLSANLGMDKHGYGRIADPRASRPLPWAQHRPQLRDTVVSFGTAFLLCGGLLVAPGAYVARLVRNRRWSLRELMVAPLLIALSVLALRLPVEDQPYNLSNAAFRYIIALWTIPAFWLLLALIRRLFTGRWLSLTLWLAVAVGISVAVACLALLTDAFTKPSDEHYRLQGWWFVLLFGVYIGGLALLLKNFVVSLVRYVQKLNSSERPAESAKAAA